MATQPARSAFEFVKLVPAATPTHYPLVGDYSRPLDEAIRACKCSENWLYNKRFRLCDGEREVTVELLELQKEARIAELAWGFKALGYRPAVLEEMLAFGERYPADLDILLPPMCSGLAAFGTICLGPEQAEWCADRQGIPMLSRDDDFGHLLLSEAILNCMWRPGIWFAVVKQTKAREIFLPQIKNRENVVYVAVRKWQSGSLVSRFYASIS